MFAKIAASFKSFIGETFKLKSKALKITFPGVTEPVPGEPELPSAGRTSVATLGLIVGHEFAAQGAKMDNGTTEYVYNQALAKGCQAYAEQNYPQLRVHIIYRDGVGVAGAYLEAQNLGCDAVIELHFNASNRMVSGSETLSTVDQADLTLAAEVHNQICKALNRTGQSRGVKVISKSDRGGQNLYAMPGGANCIVEPFFGDHPFDAKIGVAKMPDLAKAIVLGTFLWARKASLL